MAEARAIVNESDLDPELRAHVDAASAVVPVVLEAAKRLRYTDSEAQRDARSLHGTITEPFSAGVALANWAS